MSDDDLSIWWFSLVHGRLGTWWYNLRNRIGFFVSRNIFRLTPRCECGWGLVQRFDGAWVCGHCLNGRDATCPCYLCLLTSTEEESDGL